jgi:tetratricopeptide (TPR) repeat protein
MRWFKLSIPLVVVLAFAGYWLRPHSQSVRNAEAMIQRSLTRHWSTNDRAISTIQEKLKKQPDSAQWNAALGQAYLQKARETGDPSYYTKAGGLFDRALAADRKSVDAMIGQASLAMARHDFRQAKEIATDATRLNPSVAAIYGVLADALTELGDYDAAIRTLDQMVRLKPNLSSYSRISYMRELNGDVEGAIQAMRMAIDSGAPDAENTAWCMVQLGNLYLNSGRLKEAHEQYAAALARFPNYVHASAGLARVAAAQKDWTVAAHYYQTAIERVPFPDFLIGLGDVYTHMGASDQAKAQYDLVEAIEQIYRSNGVSVEVEMALFNADRGMRLQESLNALHQQWSWSKSVRVADAYAWTLYRAGHYQEAKEMMKEALRLGTRDPLFLRHAQAIGRL